MSIKSDEEGWFQRAACRGMGTPGFILDAGQLPIFGLSVCSSCPVRGECEQYAISKRCIGIWGGRNFTYGDHSWSEDDGVRVVQVLVPIRVDARPRSA